MNWLFQLHTTQPVAQAIGILAIVPCVEWHSEASTDAASDPAAGPRHALVVVEE